MYAVIRTGGKQHKVKTGETIHVELLEGSPGDKVVFDPILVVDDAGGTHVGKDLAGSTVTGVLAGEMREKKVKVFKYKAKTGYKRTQGHRQNVTVVEIADIAFKGKKAPAKKEAAPKAAKAEAPDAPPAESAE
jgi:large subunit ribosomal protein L21